MKCILRREKQLSNEKMRKFTNYPCITKGKGYVLILNLDYYTYHKLEKALQKAEIDLPEGRYSVQVSHGIHGFQVVDRFTYERGSDET